MHCKVEDTFLMLKQFEAVVTREVLSTLLLSLFHIEKCNKFRLSGICPLHKDDTHHQTIGALLLWLKKSGACRYFGIRRL